MQRRNGTLGSAKGGTARGGGSGTVPVGAANDDGLRATGGARESEVITGERAIGVANATEMTRDALIEANGMAGGAAQIVAEVAKAGVELLKDDRLGLNLTDLLSNDALGHLLEDKKTLLDDFNGLGMADELLRLNNGLGDVRAIEVVDTVEIVEVIEG